MHVMKLRLNRCLGLAVNRNATTSSFFCIGLLYLAFWGCDIAAQDASDRTTSGLIAFYDFSERNREIVYDKSRVGNSLNLQVISPDKVRRSGGAVSFVKPTILKSTQPARKIQSAIRRSGEISIEVWARTSSLSQAGPARIVSISRNSSERNITLGQDNDKIEVRLRTTKTSTNGIPSFSSKAKSLSSDLSHIVYTRKRNGESKIYINGKLNAQYTVAGDISNWNDSFYLAIGNELSNDRPWLGDLHLVAIFSRCLSTSEVASHFRAGHETGLDLVHMAVDPNIQFFERKIAPLLSKHCLECHDASNRKGELDLSSKLAAFKGGESGRVIVEGKSRESHLYEVVQDDEMPANRDPLSDDEKQLLKKWLDEGANWSLEKIDPAVYVHSGSAMGSFVQRLTIQEYIATVRDSVGVDIEKEAKAVLPPDLRVDGFTNTAYSLKVDLKHVQSYAKLAETIVDRVDVPTFAKRFGLKDRLTPESLREFVERAGEWLLRGSLDEVEISRLMRIGEIVQNSDGNAVEAASFILEAMLQSPRFIYRIENQRGDGGMWPVSHFELASRMSYIIWGSSPDKELHEIASRNELHQENVDLQIKRMLNDPRAIERSNQFLNEWLNVDRLGNLRPDAKRYPGWNEKLGRDMVNETMTFFNYIVWERRRPLNDLLNAQLTFASPGLARHYGIEAKNQVSRDVARISIPDEFAMYDLSGLPQRGGILTHGSALTIGGDESSMVARGLFLMHDFLRGVVRDPPPCVDTTPVPTKTGLTQRDIAKERIRDESCGGCHSKFEPLAFGLEKYDGIGAFHESDRHGNRLRDDGNVLFPGEAKPQVYDSSGELMELLAKNDRVAKSISWKVIQYSLGRPLGAEDAAKVDKIHAISQRKGGTYQSLIAALIKSDLVQLSKTDID